MAKNFLALLDFSRDEVESLLQRALQLKQWQKKKKPHTPLSGKTLAMIFEKSSTRTRVSFEVAMHQLGGHALNLTQETSQLGRGETYEDTARVLSRYVDAIMMRTFEQTKLERLASAAAVPVINGLSDLFHPCQLLADLMTVWETKKKLNADLKAAWVGDGNNVANSWIEAAILFGFRLTLACPKGYEPSAMMLQKMRKTPHQNIELTADPQKAVTGAEVINTDTWVSMGQEGAGEASKKAQFHPYQVNSKLLQSAHPDCMVLHCLPAHRGEEITDEVIDGEQSKVWDQAENRLHAQKALLEKLIG